MANTPNLHDLGLNVDQEPDAALPSASAEDYINDPNLEEQWAMKAFQQAETYFKLLCAIEAKKLHLTRFDDQIYTRFRETFPDLKIDLLDEDLLKSAEGKAKWRTFCEEFQTLIEDYNYGTLIRTNATGEYTSENTIFAVRIQFYAIEIARNREGFNDGVRARFGKPAL